MPTRRTYCAIDDSLLAACVHFLENSGVDVQGCTASDVVEISLKTFATFLHEEGLIPEGGIKNPTEYLDSKLKIFQHEEEPLERKSSLSAALRKVVGTSQGELQQAPDEALHAMLSDATDYSIPSEVPAPVPVAELPKEAPVDLDNPPWKEVDSIPFAELQAAAPKDMLIEYLTENPDVLMIKALEVVYAVYPLNHWSTETCTQLVRSTADKFKPYASLLEPPSE